jgi:hypothetical protein
MKKKHPYQVRWRAFRIWQKLGFNPWEKPVERRRSGRGDFYKGAFDSIPFLNDDAKRTFTHLLLRPGYMIRDYIRGAHERYLAPLTALIVFYAFFALVSSLLQPVQQKDREDFSDIVVSSDIGDNQKGEAILRNTALILQKGYTYLNLDKHPEAVKTRMDSAIAALEGTLRSQGIPLFIGQFFMLWLAMGLSLRRFKLGMSACAAASAYILCQFSFFMLFAVLMTFGESTSLGVLLMGLLLMIDFREWLGVSWKQSFKLTVLLGLWYALLFGLVLVLVAGLVVLIAWLQGA